MGDWGAVPWHDNTHIMLAQPFLSRSQPVTHSFFSPFLQNVAQQIQHDWFLQAVRVMGDWWLAV